MRTHRQTDILITILRSSHRPVHTRTSSPACDSGRRIGQVQLEVQAAPVTDDGKRGRLFPVLTADDDDVFGGRVVVVRSIGNLDQTRAELLRQSPARSSGFIFLASSPMLQRPGWRHGE